LARTLPSLIVEAMNSQTTGDLFLVTIELSHSQFDTVRFVNNTENITSNGDVYDKFPFNLTLPPDSEELSPRIRVTIPNAERDLVTEVRTIAGSREKALGTVAFLEAGDPDTILISWTDFEIDNVKYNVEVMTFDLSVEDFANEPFPSQSMTPNHFPGLF